MQGPYNKTQLNYIDKQCILSMVASEANAHQAGNQEVKTV